MRKSPAIGAWAEPHDAHPVNNTQVTIAPDGKLLLEADITYQNICPDSRRFSDTPPCGMLNVNGPWIYT